MYRQGIGNSGISLLCKLVIPFINLTKLTLNLQRNDLTDDSIYDLGKLITGFQLMEELELNFFGYNF